MDYFPLSLALGKAFCNRKTELQVLKNNLLESRPSLIVSPRRYGKTSLAMNAITQVKFTHTTLDFLSAINENDVEKIISKGAGHLISAIEKGPKKALKIATDLFAGLSIKLSLDTLGLSVEINQKSTDPAANILKILERVEKLAMKYNQKLVLFFDEFQRVYEISKNQSIESVIRQVAQRSHHLSFIFSGSNRHLLYQMFNDRNRPFYKLCDRMTLDRISENEYELYLQEVAQKTRGEILDTKTIENIFMCTERHPYYLNLLCSRLWSQKKITDEKVKEIWQDYMVEERSQVAIELDLLSQSQKKLLIALARSNGTDAPRSSEFEMISGMPGATITQALRFLEKKDYIFKNKSGKYSILDPMFKAVLAG
jgi:uncharacterized protein